MTHIHPVRFSILIAACVWVPAAEAVPVGAQPIDALPTPACTAMEHMEGPTRWDATRPSSLYLPLTPIAPVRTGLMAAASTATAGKGTKPEPDPKSDATQQAWAFGADPALPNVLILGDSISIGYTREVRALLAGKANVYRPLSDDGRDAENCNGTTKGVSSIDRWVGDRRWAVIHFNFGLHDLKHVIRPGDDTATNQPQDPRQASLGQYGQNLETIVRRLEKTGARLVFATTTPVAPGTASPLREPEAPPLYNAAALRVMQLHRVRINDLFGFCEPRLGALQLSKNVHFTASGSKVLAGEVARIIAEELRAAGTGK